MLDMGYDRDDDNGDVERRNELYDAARRQFIEETNKSVQAYWRMLTSRTSACTLFPATSC